MTVVDSSIATAELFDQLAPGLDAQTINVIERHRGGKLVQGRGWLVRRALAVADMVGLSAAFIIAMVWWAGSPVDDRVSDLLEFAIFALSLPAWILAANLYGLYSSDEERTDHSTADDLVRVFHLVTVGSWVLFLGVTFTAVADPSLQRLLTFWALAIVLITSLRALARALCRRTQRLPPEHRHRRRRGRRAARRAQAAPASRVRPQRRRLRRCSAEGAPAGPRRPQPPRHARAPRGDRAGSRGRARRHRVLERLARGDARPHPVAQGPGRPDRHRPAPVRGASARTSASTRRGRADDRPASAPAVALGAASRSGCST